MYMHVDVGYHMCIHVYSVCLSVSCRMLVWTCYTGLWNTLSWKTLKHKVGGGEGRYGGGEGKGRGGMVEVRGGEVEVR